MNKSELISVLKSKRLALIVASVAVATALSSINVHAAPGITRYNGMDRYETAAKVSKDGWKTNTDYAVIVNGENFPDSLSAAPLAKKYDAPILLTGADVLNPYTSSEINRLNVKNVFIIGGKGVVHQTIEDALKARGIKVTRLGGADRYETALQVAAKLGRADEIALVNGNNFHDGISIASIAALKGMPIILTEKDTAPASVAKYLQSNKKADQIYVVGEKDKISDNVISGFTNVKRVGSGDTYELNAGVIRAFQNEISTGTLYIASAKDFPDSLGASAIAPKTSSPVLFVDSPMSESTKEFLKSHIVNDIKVLGGSGVISYETEQIVKTLPLGVAQTENITATIWQNEKYTPVPTMVITASDGSKREAKVDWNLTKINTTKPGIYTFDGKVEGTDRIVKTTLTVKPLPYKVEDITDETNTKENYKLPVNVQAQMTDGTFSNVPVKWDYGMPQSGKPGTYVYYGTVDKYNKKVKLTLNVNNSSDTVKDLGELSPIVVGEKYPTTALDPETKKNVQVKWSKVINIDTTSNLDSVENYDDCRVYTATLEGTINSNTKVKAKISVMPAIERITTLDSIEDNIPAPVIDISRSGIVTMSDISEELRAVIRDVDGNIKYKKVTVKLWNPPVLNVDNSRNYYVTATINNYSSPVIVTLRVN